jgi:DNA replication protein DnaC
MKALEMVDSRLMELKLHGIRESWHQRLKQSQTEDLGYEGFFSLVLEDEASWRRNTRIKRLMKRAAFRQPASAEGIDYSTPRGLDKKLIADLAGCRFVLDGGNVIIHGPTGVGKSYLASALGNASCRHGYSTLFFRMNTLIEQTTLTRAKGTYLNLVKRLGVCDLLILDDFGIKPLTPQQFQDLYDILDERSEDKATVVTTQLPVENWSEAIADPITCEAITDRLVSKAVTIHMKGDSYRKRNRGGKDRKLDKV